MLKISLALATAAIAAGAFVTTAEAGGCHHGGFGGGGFFRQSYASQSFDDGPSIYDRRRRVSASRAKAKALAASKARVIAVKRGASEKTNVAKAEAPVSKIVADTSSVLKKADLETSTVASASSTSAPATCRKFSPAVGGLVDTACE